MLIVVKTGERYSFMKDFIFISGNINKVAFLELFLGTKVHHKKLDLKEVQSLSVIEVVEEKAREAYGQIQQPILIEDTTLKFEALGRLPGTFIKYFLDELGNEGLCKLLDNKNRHAVATVTYGYYDGNIFEYFGEEVEGVISNEPRGSGGHGWDPIFIPKGQDLTYGEMDEAQYSEHAVRNKAVKCLKSWLNDSKDKE